MSRKIISWWSVFIPVSPYLFHCRTWSRGRGRVRSHGRRWRLGKLNCCWWRFPPAIASWRTTEKLSWRWSRAMGWVWMYRRWGSSGNYKRFGWRPGWMMRTTTIV